MEVSGHLVLLQGIVWVIAAIILLLVYVPVSFLFSFLSWIVILNRQIQKILPDLTQKVFANCVAVVLQLLLQKKY